MTQTYRLLKDLPGVNAGALFTQERDSTWSNQEHSEPSQYVVRVASGKMDDKEWFEPVADTPPQIEEINLTVVSEQERQMEMKINQLVRAVNTLTQKESR